MIRAAGTTATSPSRGGAAATCRSSTAVRRWKPCQPADPAHPGLIPKKAPDGEPRPNGEPLRTGKGTSARCRQTSSLPRALAPPRDRARRVPAPLREGRRNWSVDPSPAPRSVGEMTADNAVQTRRGERHVHIGGDLPVRRLGFGAMRLTGPGIWGPPEDPDEAVRVLRRAVELGITFIDTADSYGPDVSEQLIREALHPYPDDLVIATKAGQVRPGPGTVGAVGPPGVPRPAGRAEPAPARRRAASTSSSCTGSTRGCRSPTRSATLADAAEQGKIRHIGLSEVTVERARGGPGDRRDRLGAEPLQPHRPPAPRRCSSTPSARASRSSRGLPIATGKLAPTGRPARRDRQGARRRRPANSRWPGCCAVRRSCCRSRARRRWATSRTNTAAALIDLSDEEFDALTRAA